MLADKIPAVNHINDLIQTFVRPVAGAIAFAAGTNVINGINPVVALACGLLVAGSVHLAKSAAVRPFVTATTAGVGKHTGQHCGGRGIHGRLGGRGYHAGAGRGAGWNCATYTALVADPSVEGTGASLEGKRRLQDTTWIGTSAEWQPAVRRNQ